MAIQTTLKLRQKWLDPLYGVVCVAFALWGAYDYFVKIPAQEKAVAEYAVASTTIDQLQQKVAGGSPLTPDETLSFTTAEAKLAEFKGAAPSPPAFYDRWVQIWLYMVGCGILGAPWFFWVWWVNRSRSYSMDDDGTVHTPEGTFPPEDVADIDMSRWMSKSIATLKTTDGKAIVLDDYKYKNMHLIVGAYASKFYPADWTDDARDRHKIEAEEAASQPTSTTDSTEPSSRD